MSSAISEKKASRTKGVNSPFQNDKKCRSSCFEYYCIKTKGVLRDYMQLTSSFQTPGYEKRKDNEVLVHKGKTILELEECLTKINSLIDAQGSDIRGVQGSIVILLDHNFMTLLAMIGILNSLQIIFDQQILLLKRLLKSLLVSNCVLNGEASSSIPVSRIIPAISQCLGIFLADFTNLRAMNLTQLKFIKNILPSVLSVYEKYPIFIEMWLRIYCHQRETFVHLTEKGYSLFENDYDNCEFLPIYEILYSILFVDKGFDCEIGSYFSRLVRLLSNETRDTDACKRKWLVQYSDIPAIFISEFIKQYELSISDSNTSAVKEYQKYLIILLDVVANSFPAFQEKCLRIYEEEFFLFIWKSRRSCTSTLFEYSLVTIECMLSYLERPVFQRFVLSIFEESILLELLFDEKHLQTSTHYLEKFFQLMNQIILKDTTSSIVKNLFCSKGQADVDYTDANLIKRLRIKAMKVYQNEFIRSLYERETSNTIMRINSHFTKRCLEHILEFDGSKIIPQMINSTLLSFFQNKPAINKVLGEIIINLLTYKSGCISHVLGNNECMDLCYILDFLVEAFLEYGDTISAYQDKKYQTIDSARTSDIEEHEYLRPNKRLLDSLSFQIPSQSTMLIEHDTLITNMQNFQEFYMSMYFCCNVRHIIRTQQLLLKS